MTTGMTTDLVGKTVKETKIPTIVIMRGEVMPSMMAKEETTTRYSNNLAFDRIT
jgi:hypothetical protein